MSLLLRTLKILLTSWQRPKVKTLAEITTTSFRVMPWDLDQYFHMNHARYLTYYEVGRLDLQVRTGFLKMAIRNRWSAPIKRIECDFHRPLKLFQKFEVSVQIVKADADSLDFYQEMKSRDKVISRLCLKSVIRKGRQTILPAQYMQPLGYDPGQILPAQQTPT